MHRPFLALGLFLLSLAPAFAETPIPAAPTRAALVARTTEAVTVLNKLYWSKTIGIWLDRAGDDVRGHYDGRVNPPWWSAANTVETLLDLMNTTGSKEYEAMIESLYEIQKDKKKNEKPLMIAELKRRGQWTEADDEKLRKREEAAAQRTRERKPNDPPSRKDIYWIDFRNEYLDDSAWWGIAWLKMYDRTRAPKYLATARAIHTHMARNWRPDKAGGVMWCEDDDKLHPNAITNSLFIILSARLYERTHEKADLEWAEKGLAWFRAVGLYDGTAVVDQPGHKGDYWTYNQGTYLGALVALYRATGKADYLEEAAKAAETILARSGDVLPSGVIVEKLGTNGWDPGLFKGVFARYLGQLRDALKAAKEHPELVAKIDQVLQASTASLIAFGLGADGQYHIAWHESTGEPTRNFNTQTAALALFVSTFSGMNP